MTDTVLTVGIPTLAVLVGILVNNSPLSDLRVQMSQQISELRAHMDGRFSAFEKVVDARFEAAHQELLRVEGVLDARLSNVEARLSHLER